jgi:hypothetical protein
MKFIGGINRLLSIVSDTFRQFPAGRIWGVLLAYYFLQWLVLLAHYQFTSPAFGWLASITLSFQDSQRAVAFTHYPAHLILLPGVYGWAKLGFGVLLEGLVLGFVATEFCKRFGVRTDSNKSIVSRWLHLLIIWVVINALALAIGEIVPSLMASKLYSPKRIAVFTFVIMPAIFTVCSMLFFYAFAVVASTGKNALVALGQSLRFLVSNPMTTFVLTVLVIAVPVLLSAVSGAYATTLVDKFRPELVYWLLVTGIIVDMISTFLWMGFSVRLLADESA